MKPFLIPILVQTNNYSLEKMVVGLIGVSDEIFVEISYKKVELIKGLISGSLSSFLKENLAILKKNIVESNNKKINLSDKLYSTEVASLFEYFKYLVDYSNNTILFGDAIILEAHFEYQEFIGFFSKFVGEWKTLKHPHHRSLKSELADIFSTPYLDTKADIDLKIPRGKLSGMVKDFTASLLTKNGVIKSYQVIDFGTSEDTIAKNIYEYEAFASNLNELSMSRLNVSGVYNIVSRLPEPGSVQMEIYREFLTVKKDKFGILDLKEFEKHVISISRSDRFSKLTAILDI
ncbi:hypothetical protein [Siphonobacter aquaeclarae]|uniref:Uncharacterized protein n=1 Tax=Siphonobacter aquaeclarae TaxID=563176 RepID=A0A1G9HV66_9BACT|nr:hypothetical protein [Siphonobacter aquaeclarae]SDL16839.1 hypothetical protein SAMN04488090_0220 [Siphonobacter aquaeclarae]